MSYIFKKAVAANCYYSVQNTPVWGEKGTFKCSMYISWQGDSLISTYKILDQKIKMQNFYVGSGNHLIIFNKGIVNSANGHGGHTSICSGGTANNISIGSGSATTYQRYDMGFLNIFSGGIANSTVINYRGYAYVSVGGVANYTNVHYDGELMVYSGGIINSTTTQYLRFYQCFFRWNCKLYIIFREGGNGTSWGIANSTIINAEGELRISSGGTAISTTVNSRGRLSVCSGCTALNVKSNTGAYVYSSAGAVITYV